MVNLKPTAANAKTVHQELKQNKRVYTHLKKSLLGRIQANTEPDSFDNGVMELAGYAAQELWGIRFWTPGGHNTVFRRTINQLIMRYNDHPHEGHKLLQMVMVLTIGDLKREGKVRVKDGKPYTK